MIFNFGSLCTLVMAVIADNSYILVITREIINLSSCKSSSMFVIVTLVMGLFEMRKITRLKILQSKLPHKTTSRFTLNKVTLILHLIYFDFL